MKSTNKNQLVISGQTSETGADKAAQILAWGKAIALVLCAIASLIGALSLFLPLL